MPPLVSDYYLRICLNMTPATSETLPAWMTPENVEFLSLKNSTSSLNNREFKIHNALIFSYFQLKNERWAIWYGNWCLKLVQKTLRTRLKHLFHSSQKPTRKLAASAFKYCDWMKVRAASLWAGFCDEYKRGLSSDKIKRCDVRCSVDFK